MFNFNEISIERPVGTKGNNKVLNLLQRAFALPGYTVIELPFYCTIWQPHNSFVKQHNKKIEIFPSPFSRALKGRFPIKYVSSLTVLKKIKDFKGILVFKNKLTKEGLMPKNFPFYFPDEHRLIYNVIEKINPKGIITVSGQDPASGLNPFPIFEDANFEIPTAYMSSLNNITDIGNIYIEINSKIYRRKSKQLVFKKTGLSKEIILIAAHLDTKYFTNGAIDNAAGLYTLYNIANLLKKEKYNHTIHIVPFNGEESPEVPGQLAYLKYLEENNLKIKSVINIDGVGGMGSESAFSFFNFDRKTKKQIITKNNIPESEPWYSGDHAMFAFQEIPCIAITASNMFTDLMKITHTKNDIAELVNIKLLEQLGESTANIVKFLDVCTS